MGKGGNFGVRPVPIILSLGVESRSIQVPIIPTVVVAGNRRMRKRSALHSYYLNKLKTPLPF